MVIIRGRFRWDAGEPPTAEMGRLAALVRERHAGNIDYRLAVDSGDASQLHLNEAWESLADFEAHGQTPEVAELLALVAPGARDFTLEVFDATRLSSSTVDLGR